MLLSQVLLFPALALGAAIPPAIYGAVAASGSDADEENNANNIKSTFSSETSAHGNRTIISSTTTRSYSCHDGWVSWSMVKYLYFKAPTQQLLANDTIICITTPWYAHYSNSIKPRLEKELGLQSIEMQQQCGWIEIAQVNAARIWRGNIEWYNERFMNNAPLSDEVPSNRLVNDIGKIMVGTFPAVEIGLIVFFTVGIVLPFCILLFIGPCIWVERRAAKRRR